MRHDRFMEYIRRFNEQDETAFEEFLSPTMHMKNGTLEFTGVDGMKAHYAKIWGNFREVLDVRRFVSDDDTAAIQMNARFEALHDDPDSLFGPVETGDRFEFNGLNMYRIDSTGRFDDILVAYNSFTSTRVGAQPVELGIPH